MIEEVNPQTNKYFLHYKQLNTFDHPYHIHKYLECKPSAFLLVNRCIIFNEFDNHFQLHMIIICTGALSGQGPNGAEEQLPTETRYTCAPPPPPRGNR